MPRRSAGSLTIPARASSVSFQPFVSGAKLTSGLQRTAPFETAENGAGCPSGRGAARTGIHGERWKCRSI